MTLNAGKEREGLQIQEKGGTQSPGRGIGIRFKESQERRMSGWVKWITLSL